MPTTLACDAVDGRSPMMSSEQCVLLDGKHEAREHLDLECGAVSEPGRSGMLLSVEPAMPVVAPRRSRLVFGVFAGIVVVTLLSGARVSGSNAASQAQPVAANDIIIKTGETPHNYHIKGSIVPSEGMDMNVVERTWNNHPVWKSDAWEGHDIHVRGRTIPVYFFMWHDADRYCFGIGFAFIHVIHRGKRACTLRSGRTTHGSEPDEFNGSWEFWDKHMHAWLDSSVVGDGAMHVEQVSDSWLR